MTHADLETQAEKLRRTLAELIYRARGNMLDPDVQRVGAELNQLVLLQMRLEGLAHSYRDLRQRREA